MEKSLPVLQNHGIVSSARACLVVEALSMAVWQRAGPFVETMTAMRGKLLDRTDRTLLLRMLRLDYFQLEPALLVLPELHELELEQLMWAAFHRVVLRHLEKEEKTNRVMI